MPPIAERFFGGLISPSQAQEEAVKMAQPPKSVEESGLFSPRTLECDFDKAPSELYLLLQSKDWDGAIERTSTHPDEVRTWVARREFDGKLRWRLLPLHAAIIFKAPENVIEAILGAFPHGAESKDDQGMLPLHLAFRNGSTEGVVNLLLVAYPQSIDVKDRKGRIPLVLAQASTSPNKEAFMRALERGPTYYAVAAAATERAAVTAELRAIFDAKLMEIKNQHQQEVQELKELAINDKQELEDRVVELEAELAKSQETSQVLVDHVNSLEAQLNSRGDTERFLATKIATLDSSLRDVSRVKEENEGALTAENRALKQANGELTIKLAYYEDEVANLSTALRQKEEELEDMSTTLDVTREKSIEEIQRLEREWAQAKAGGAVLEAQLKKKIETEHSLATQVSTLASKLAESAADSSNVSVSYAARVESLMTERSKLRQTVVELTKKLSFVAEELEKVSAEQDKIITAAAGHETTMAKVSQMHADIVANSTHHEKIVVQVSEERRQILDILVRQEKEILESSEERQRLKAAIDFGEEQAARAAEERRDLVYQVHKQQQDVRKIVDVDLSIIPKGSADELGPNELVDEVVKRTVAMLAREGPNGEAALKQEEKKEEPEQRSTFARPSVITNPAEEEMIDRIEAAREALTSP